jgi:hypothetical protein
VAAWYADSYRSELDTVPEELSHDQESALVLSRLYLSTVSSIGHLGQFIHVKRWLSIGSPEAQERKRIYLAARKQFQGDVDGYFSHFAYETSANVNEALQDTVNMAYLLVRGRNWVSAATDTYNHIFLGSVLSERAVMVSLRQHVNAGARYGTAEEDSSPTKADVVLPLPQGDMHVQVKMKWMEPTALDIRPNKKPLHVIVPMHVIRSGLTEEEDEKLAVSVMAAAERKAA